MGTRGSLRVPHHVVHEQLAEGSQDVHHFNCFFRPFICDCDTLKVELAAADKDSRNHSSGIHRAGKESAVSR